MHLCTLIYLSIQVWTFAKLSYKVWTAPEKKFTTTSSSKNSKKDRIPNKNCVVLCSNCFPFSARKVTPKGRPAGSWLAEQDTISYWPCQFHAWSDFLLWQILSKSFEWIEGCSCRSIHFNELEEESSRNFLFLLGRRRINDSVNLIREALFLRRESSPQISKKRQRTKSTTLGLYLSGLTWTACIMPL